MELLQPDTARQLFRFTDFEAASFRVYGMGLGLHGREAHTGCRLWCRAVFRGSPSIRRYRDRTGLLRCSRCGARQLISLSALRCGSGECLRTSVSALEFRLCLLPRRLATYARPRQGICCSSWASEEWWMRGGGHLSVPMAEPLMVQVLA